MGVHNTSFERITIYLKEEHIEFLDNIISQLGESKQTIPNRSELVRALLDKYSGTNDWQSKQLYQIICKNNIEKKSK